MEAWLQALLVVGLFLGGCDEPPPVTAALPRTSTAPCDATLDPRRAPLDELEVCQADVTREAERLAGSAEGVTRARQAADLAVARWRRSGEPEPLEAARAQLRRAAARRGVPGACEAALALARLEARERGEPAAAYLEAYRLVRRFDGLAGAGCVEAARRMLAVLAPFRPPASELAAVDADPDADDPSVGLDDDPPTEPSGEGTPSDPFVAWARAQPATASATLTGVAVLGGAGGADAARVVLTVSDVVRFESSPLPADGALPPRLAVLLPSTSIAADVPPSLAVGAGGLVRVRATQDGPGARVTLDLEAEARTVLFVLPEPFRVVIDVHSDAPRPPRAREVTGAPRSLDLLVLDPGHGGDDFGARAFGLREADVTLDLARRVRAILRERLPRTRVVLTREEDRFVSLEQRTAMANAVGADAFVSIHLNAAWEPVDRGGVTTFVLDTTDDRQAVRLAARENGTSTREVGALSRILAGLHRQEQAVGSAALAQHLHEGTLAGARRVLPRLYDRGVRTAMFHVLVGARMPAVLVEASFMTRPDEAEALRTDAYRQALAEGLADGLVRFARGG